MSFFALIICIGYDDIGIPYSKYAQGQMIRVVAHYRDNIKAKEIELTSSIRASVEAGKKGNSTLATEFVSIRDTAVIMQPRKNMPQLGDIPCTAKSHCTLAYNARLHFWKFS